jgi:hypothetical protein
MCVCVSVYTIVEMCTYYPNVFFAILHSSLTSILFFADIVTTVTEMITL